MFSAHFIKISLFKLISGLEFIFIITAENCRRSIIGKNARLSFLVKILTKIKLNSKYQSK